MPDPAEPAFLTPEWGTALEATANDTPTFRDAVADLELALGQEVSEVEGGGGEQVTYTMRFSGGRLAVDWGTLDGADVVFALSRDTAERMHAGDLNAQQAFVLGKLRVRGNPERLLGAREAFLELGDVFGSLRSAGR